MEEHDSTEGDSKLGRVSSGLKTVAAVAAVVSLAGLIFYGTILIGYFRFYGAFHVTPEDTGLGYTTILSRSEGFILLSCLLGVYVLSVFVVWGFLKRRKWKERSPFYKVHGVNEGLREKRAPGARAIRTRLWTLLVRSRVRVQLWKSDLRARPFVSDAALFFGNSRHLVDLCDIWSDSW